jgi:hypothetical protein
MPEKEGMARVVRDGGCRSFGSPLRTLEGSVGPLRIRGAPEVA